MKGWFKRNRNVLKKDKEKLYAKKLYSFMKLQNYGENLCEAKRRLKTKFGSIHTGYQTEFRS